MQALDTLRLDRDLKRAAAEWRRWRRQLRRGEAVEDPFAMHRAVTTRSSFRSIAELSETDPLRRPLLRWTYRLAEQRINGAALAHLAATWQEPAHGLNQPERGRYSLGEMLARALREPARSTLWLDALAERAAANAAAAVVLWERRLQLAQGFGVDDPDAMELPGPHVFAAAEAFLRSTQDAFDALSLSDLASFIDCALGRDGVEGWPARLVPRALFDLLRETHLLADVSLDPGPLPGLIAASSFVRALRRVGAAFVDATAPVHQPFVIAHDPHGLERRRIGALVGGLPSITPFARRALGLSGARLERHQRALARVTLLEGRALALRVLVRRAALQGQRSLARAIEELSVRALGFALDPRLAAVLFRLHAGDAQRFAGLLLAAELGARLTQRHDEDWFRNPHAIEEIRGSRELSPATEAEEGALAEGSRSLSLELAARVA